VIDNDAVTKEVKAYEPIPETGNFRDENGIDRMDEIINHNYRRIKDEVKQIVAEELAKIEADPELRQLIKK
jgi:hypothetical protein